MIKNSTKLTKENVSLFQRKFSSKSNTVSLIMTLIVIVCGSIEISLGDTTFGIFCIAFGIIFFPVLLFMQKVANDKNVKSMLLQNVYNNYEFGDDNIVIQTFRGDTKVGESVIEYGQIVKVQEYDSTYYIYISSRQAFIVDKNSFTEGTQTDLTIMLATKLGDRYKVKLSKKQINENKQ